LNVKPHPRERLIVKCGGIVCILGAVYLASVGAPGWGWLLFVGALVLL
jgi:hypothetical protein